MWFQHLLLLPSSEASMATPFSNKLSESVIVPPVQTTGVVAALVNAPAVTCDRTIATPFMVGSTIPALQTTEVYDGHDHVEVFDELRDTQVWYVINAVRVRFVYNNVPDNNLQLFLLDKYGKTFTVVVYDRRLLPRYKLMNLVGGVFEIHHFQIGYTAYGFPKYEGYTLHRNLYEIVISKNTRVVPTKGDLAKTIPNFPLPVGSLKKDLINEIFPFMELNGFSSDYIISRAILSTKNENVDEINDELIDKFPGDEEVYYSFDEAEDDTHNHYPIEFLNSFKVSGLPPHCLRLKVGCPVILLRNIDPSNGLCNGTRLICKSFQRNVIDAEIAVGEHAGKRVFLPRIPLCPSENDMFPFKLKRKQFPIRLSFAMTINKAQGQTIPNVGIYLPESVFSHGQLYVALSRGISREKTKVLVRHVKDFNRSGVYTANVVYREVLHDV